MKHFGTDGIRKKAEEFTPEFLAAVARGLVEYGGDEIKVFLAGDTRESSEWILADLAKAFEALGVEYALAGVLPTPAINYCFSKMGFDFAIDVTASHNPYTDNGIKIFERGTAEGFNNNVDARNREGSDESASNGLGELRVSGRKLSEKGREIIEKALLDLRPLPEVSASDREDLHEEAVALYKEHLLNYVRAVRPAKGSELKATEGKSDASKNWTATNKLDESIIDFSGLKIALDCANGATSVIGGRVFEELGARVTHINTDSSYGTKINDNAGSTHIEGLSKLVLENGLDFGAAFDGDGDRCLLVDAEGEIVDGDQIIALLTTYFNLPAAAVTVMSNQGLFDWANQNDVRLAVTAVGDANVSLAMKEQGILIGGEQSGHIILPGEATGDGLLTALVVAKVVAESGRSLKELALVMEKFPQVIVNLEANKEQKEQFKTSEKVKALLEEYEKRLLQNSGRLLVRPSGTENLIRITMWGKDLGEITELAEELKEGLRGVL